MPSRLIHLLLVPFLLAGCITIQKQATATMPALIITSTLPPTFTPQPTDTPLPTAIPPSAAPIEGLTSTQVNIRSAPSTASETLGVILFNTKVQIIGKDSSGNWYQINYPQGRDGKGWVTAQYVTTPPDSVIPIIGGGASTNTAVMIQKVNVRSGPGTDFNSIGILNLQDVANLTGKNSDGTWLQIEFASGPSGRGWISAAFAQAKGTENLPIVTEAGQIVGTGTPTGIPLTPTPTIIAIHDDNDSAQSPGVNILFTSSGVNSFQYSSGVSSPKGDAEDWIQFTPNEAHVSIELSCKGNGNLTVGLLQNGTVVQGSSNIGCDTKQIVDVIPGSTYLIHLKANGSNHELQNVIYTLWIASIR